MIKEGSSLFIAGRSAVVPFQGKYAVRRTDVFEAMDAGMALPAEWPYRPLRVELEITDKCNDSCAHCGMGAKSLSDGRNLSSAAIERLIDDFASVGLPSVAVTGGEPFVAQPRLIELVERARGRVDISKLTTNGFWGTEAQCERTIDQLVAAGLLENRFFVPLIMVSIGEQTVPLDRVCRLIHTLVERFPPEALNVGLSALSVRGQGHKVKELKTIYASMFGQFPDGRVHSTIRVYLANERIEGQAAELPAAPTSVTRWMRHCYDCFAPTVGAYVLPTGLLKLDGDFYSCAAFNVPERLRLGNVYEDGFRAVLEEANRRAYIAKVRSRNGLAGLADTIPKAVTDKACADGYCDACSFLVDEFERDPVLVRLRARRDGPVIAGS